MNVRPTLPVQPWDIPDPTGERWDQTPSEDAILSTAGPVDKGVIHKRKSGRPSDTAILLGRTFQGRLNVSDLDYMAKAILQICDENHELRERIRRLEERADRSGQA